MRHMRETKRISREGTLKRYSCSMGSTTRCRNYCTAQTIHYSFSTIQDIQESQGAQIEML